MTDGEYETNYVAEPIQLSDDLFVGIVAFGGEGRSDDGVDLLDEDYNVKAELDIEECKELVKELAEFITV